MSSAQPGQPLIRFTQVSKKFRLNRQKTRTIFDLFRRMVRQGATEEFFWPLQAVSFALHGGVTIGVIGENGSGKSTLLKLISRILEPTSGQVEINGRVSALLELGAGFHHELTGRENIYLHASLLGLQQSKIDTVLDDIIAFADIGPFIDTPVKHYSSGMYARLGFAIAIHVEPDILLVDEVLAVGDESFQRRCLDAIQRLQARGVAILLVSHSLSQVLDLCDQCLWLDNGQLMAMGETRMVIRRYLDAVDEAMAQRLLDENSRRLLNDQEQADQAALQPPRRWGNGPLRIDQVQMYNAAQNPVWSFAPLATISIKLTYTAEQPVAEPIFSVLIHKLDGYYLWASNTLDHPVGPITQAGSGELTVCVEALALTAGRYYLSAAAYCEPDPPYWQSPSDFHEQLYEFQIVSADEIHGDVVMPSQWRHRAPADALTRPAPANPQPQSTTVSPS
ncbi:MAG: ABC transporter ATP-binding protein [Caldilineaceae bacterium]|nr:ABC transporter ATP-binding protein [Caldilineaceae bacterium]